MSAERMPIRISVLISTYNRARYLPACLDSLLAQTRPPDEILVIDDGSTDDTPAVAKQYAGRIRYKRQENQGKSVALNGAIPEAIGTHVCVFDDDDVMLPDALARHETYLNANLDIDYSYSGKYFFDDYPGQAHDIWASSEWRVGQLDACPPEQLLIKTMEWNGTLMQGMLVPVRCLQAVGLFDATMLRTQDYDMMLKLARNFRGASVDAITFVHRNHGGARGPGKALHDEKKRHAVWHDFDRQLFRRVRADYALAEFLPRAAGVEPQCVLSSEQESTALFTRADVMFRRGLFSEGGQDIARLLSAPQLSESRLADIERLLAKVANIGVPDYVVGAPGLARALNATRKGPAKDRAIKSVRRGFYWGLRGATSRRYPKHVLLFGQALALSALPSTDQS